MWMEQSWWMDILRSIFTVFDKIGFALLSFVYKIFFTISTATILSGDLIRNFYARIQLILGIIMIFKLSMSILNIIINPDSIKDQKQGAGKIVTRVAVALFMLTLIIPINISVENEEKTSLNSYVSDHGVLFGFLYKFQQSMLKENIIGKLILGTSSTQDTTVNADINDLSDIGNTMATSVARAFFRPRVRDESEAYCKTDEDPDYDPSNPCPNIVCPTEVYNSGYSSDLTSPDELLSSVNKECNDGEYAFSYIPFLGLAASIVMAIIVLGFTIDVAVRAIKLAILRMIAPIPIISYIDPKSEKDGAFGNWTKSLISTYIDLFIRLAIIYFGAYIIQTIFTGGIELPNSGDGIVNAFATVALIIGVLIFMKQAPKFLKDMLGIKGAPMGNAGLSGILGGAAMAIGGGGMAGFGLGLMQGMSASADAQAQGKAMTPFSAWTQNRDQMAKIRTGDKDARGGIIGRTMDRALYNARERQLGIKGLTAENADKAKDLMYQQQDMVRRAQDIRDLAFERLKSYGIAGDPSGRPALVAPNEQDFTDANGVLNTTAYAQAQTQYNDQVRQRQAQQALWDDYKQKAADLAEAQKKYAKMEKNYKNISGARTAMGVDPRQYDEYTPGHQYTIMGHQVFDRRAGVYRAGANRARFRSDSEGMPSTIDDLDVLGGIPETGASPNTR